jgi:5-methylthioadenosine/S-adenosylhomocysteine deaminase
MEWLAADLIFVDGDYRPGRWLAVEDGVIRAVADRPPERTGVRTFHRAAIFPGTVNTHTHAFHSLLRGLGDDLPLLAWLNDVVYRYGARFTAEHAYLGAALAFAEMARNGVTTVVDFFYLNGAGTDPAQATIRAAEDVGIRLVLARTFMDWERAPATIREDAADATRRYAEVARAYRGHPTVRVCPAAHSVYATSPEMIRAARDLAREEGTPWHMHVGDARGAEDLIRQRWGRSTVERMEDLGLPGADLVAVHGVYVNDDEVKRLAGAGVKVAHCPSPNMFLGDGVARVLAMRRAGMVVGLGTDGGLANNTLSVFHEMKMTALVQKSMAGDPAAITAREIIEMATVAGAAITGWPVGRLAPGCAADFVVIDLDDLALVPGERLASHMVYSMSDRAIRDVYVAGRPVVQDGRLARVDARDLGRRVEAALRGLRASL